jgi:poly(3-hydroxybutyrate) depolymerase
MRNARVFGLLAVIAVISALAVPPLWSALAPDHRVRPSDAAGTPAPAVNPAPKMGTLPPQSSRTQAEAMEILRRHGYIDISNPAAQSDGSWTAEAAKEFNGRKVTVVVDRGGNVAERPPSTEAGR